MTITREKAAYPGRPYVWNHRDTDTGRIVRTDIELFALSPLGAQVADILTPIVIIGAIALNTQMIDAPGSLGLDALLFRIFWPLPFTPLVRRGLRLLLRRRCILSFAKDRVSWTQPWWAALWPGRLPPFDRNLPYTFSLSEGHPRRAIEEERIRNSEKARSSSLGIGWSVSRFLLGSRRYLVDARVLQFTCEGEDWPVMGCFRSHIARKLSQRAQRVAKDWEAIAQGRAIEEINTPSADWRNRAGALPQI